MAMLDRRKIKWSPPFHQPEKAKMRREFLRDTELINKPFIDEHEAEEFDLRIIYSMKYNHSVKLTIG